MTGVCLIGRNQRAAVVSWQMSSKPISTLTDEANNKNSDASFVCVSKSVYVSERGQVAFRLLSVTTIH